MNIKSYIVPYFYEPYLVLITTYPGNSLINCLEYGYITVAREVVNYWAQDGIKISYVRTYVETLDSCLQPPNSPYFQVVYMFCWNACSGILDDRPL